ncbi:helix-turn-helix domain-containing protein [Desulfitobacterium chlororespirans]|uniref:DNA-binding transcriptional regulator, XRE-family HTH domain n=1 Tax=Desulfitobacterium chlororespirans DSM 11544 TaxID=1121395 RepID=A0A1M7UP28_9FIRM|nr:helix-turn-helix transcriptional regulator [Desulfitobacterium chlororespirans]SHN84762.1 DNA-binding transcriptional regulator, XRE-family HTH domain [Desulfitobacterium chlororespirans DSM 11544]
MGFGRNVARYRKLRKMRQADLAQETGLSKGYISRIERGEAVPGAKTAAIIAEKLKIGMDDLKKE